MNCPSNEHSDPEAALNCYYIGQPAGSPKMVPLHLCSSITVSLHFLHESSASSCNLSFFWELPLINLSTCRNRRSAEGLPRVTPTRSYLTSELEDFSPQHNGWKPRHPGFPLGSYQKMGRNIDTKMKGQAGCLFLTLATWKASQDKTVPEGFWLNVAKQTNKGLVIDIYNFSLRQLF